MSQEKRFYALLLNAGYSNAGFEYLIPHPTIPGAILEVDNIAQKGQTVFVFEAKKWKPKDAVTQLVVRFQVLYYDKSYFINKKRFDKYNQVRLFFYSLNGKLLIEYDYKSNVINQLKFNDMGELTQILRKL